MDVAPPTRLHNRGRGDAHRSQSRNKQWTAGNPNGATPNQRGDGERWERGGGHRGRGRGTGGRGAGGSAGGGRKFPNRTLNVAKPTTTTTSGNEELPVFGNVDIDEPVLETQEEREKFYQDLVKAREVERKKAIAEGKMDDPLVPKRLEDAITMVGTCMDMCPRFERYRRERENNLTEWETIPGTKRVDHKRAVKMYERAAGDKTLPSDLRPPIILKRTLDYLFRQLLPTGGFHRAFSFIRDRSRAVRNDFTMQHETGPLAMECHERCARFHILALHFERDETDFSIPMEEQQLMYALQSLKEFYADQRDNYQSPHELEMRVYHRLIHIRDQRERHDDIPTYITEHPVFKLTTDFRLHVQKRSAPITKTSKLAVDAEGMAIFGELARVLREGAGGGNVVMVYLVACILERLFGKDAIDGIEDIRGTLEIWQIIDGEVGDGRGDGEESMGNGDADGGMEHYDELQDEKMDDDAMDDDADTGDEHQEGAGMRAPSALRPGPTEWLNNTFGGPLPSVFPTATATAFPSTQPTQINQGPPPMSSSPGPTAPLSAFAGLTSAPNPFGTPSVFGSGFGSSTHKATPPKSVFGTTFPTSTALASPSGVGNEQGQFGLGTTTNSSPFGTFGQTPAPAQPQPFDSARKSTPLQGASGGRQALPSVLNVAAPAFIPSHPSSLASASAPGVGERMAGTPLKAQPKQHSTPVTLPGLATTVNVLSPLPPWTSPTPPTSVPAAATAPTISSSLPTPITPTLPKLNATINASVSSDASMLSPRIPPPMDRKQPISLPSTPTAEAATPPAIWPHLGFLKSGGLTPTSSVGAMGDGPLSPLLIHSPTVSRQATLQDIRSTPPGAASSSSSLGSLRKLVGMPSVPSVATATPPQLLDTVKPLSSKGKEKARMSADTRSFDEEQATDLANGFAKREVVRRCLRRWVRRTADRAAWRDACSKSEAYREKVESERKKKEREGVRNGSPSEKRRRRNSDISDTSTRASSPAKKRVKRRVSDKYQPPRTDADLAQRLKENQEEHERRWTRGSFLDTISTQVRRKAHACGLHKPLPSWRTWISLNPESDATAIWLERKFDIPNSGKWVSEVIFEIPLAAQGDEGESEGFPGLIIFERTPLNDITDDIERKYRILDDCSRLRDILKSLPQEYHFVPSLLVLSWLEAGQPDTVASELGSDFDTMIKEYINASVLKSFSAFPFSFTSDTRDDVDAKFGAYVQGVIEGCDVVGEKVQALHVRGVFQQFQPALSKFVLNGLEKCWMDGEFDWMSYKQLLSVFISLLNDLIQLVGRLTGTGVGKTIKLLPPYEASTPATTSTSTPLSANKQEDSDSLYVSTIAWLEGATIGPTPTQTGETDNIVSDLTSHRSMGRDFPSTAFLEHLAELARCRLERGILAPPNTSSSTRPSSSGGDGPIFYVPKSQLRAMKDEFDVVSERKGGEARRKVDSTGRQRRLREDSNTSERLSNGMKAANSSAEHTSSKVKTNGRTHNPPGARREAPSGGVDMPESRPDGTEKVVTLDMLKALTRDIKMRYGAGGL
ncbi:hypothetical protein BDN71DRAFT_1589686 [Pleurotus eryngii]|uniref:SAC3/GANP/THP3 conserved domain-containing protein n=1 Tax=Pleurotus eryngii TaxID=5323 RepID=A0A9P6A0C9_PLEER|nr:hypothetical protein BDN71DRAFT_1589686 [Pleurotus eryngii]